MLRLLVVTTTLLHSTLTTAEVLPDPDNGPISGAYNFVDSTEGAELLGKGQLAFSLTSLVSSHSVLDEQGAESVLFDGETARLEWRLRYGFGERIELGIELPWVWHSAGRLDSLIDSWHDTFGLPDGFRDDLPRDRLRYRYADERGIRLDFQESTGGLGDLRLMAGFRLGNRLGNATDHRLALRFGLVVPTGDADELLGTDAVSVSAGFAGDLRSVGGSERFSAYYGAHLSWIDEPALLPDRHREWVGHVSGGFGYRVSPRVDLRAQVAVRTATHDSELLVLGEPSVALSFGGNIRLSERYLLSLMVGEDIKVNSSPDVTFLLALRYRGSKR